MQVEGELRHTAADRRRLELVAGAGVARLDQRGPGGALCNGAVVGLLPLEAQRDQSLARFGGALVTRGLATCVLCSMAVRLHARD